MSTTSESVSTAPATPEVEAPETPAAKAPAKKKAGDGKEFVVELADLQPALNAATRATANGGVVESLSNIRLAFSNSRLTVAGTDAETGISVKIPVKGRSTATAFVEARRLANIAKALEGDEATITVTDDAVVIAAGEFAASLRNRAGDGFTFPAVPSGKARKVPAFEYLAAVKRVLDAAYAADDRPILTGVLHTAADGKLVLAATDSFRLAVAAPGIGFAGKPANVPAGVLADLARLVTEDDEHVEITVDAHRIGFGLGEDRIVTARLIDGEYPPYEKLIPGEKALSHTAEVDRAALTAAVKRVRLMTSGDEPVRLTLGKGSVRVSAATEDVGIADEKIKAKVEGGTMTVAFNPGYLLDALGSFADDEVTIAGTDEIKPALVHAGRPQEHLYLLMPVRIS